MLRTTRNLFLIGLGIVCLIVGLIGIPMPVLPAIPFLLASAYCFSVGSPRLHDWLLSRPNIGPLIIYGQKHWQISLRAKIIWTLLLCAAFGLILWIWTLPDFWTWYLASIGTAALFVVWALPLKRY